jgi:hypothetical protein
MASAGSRKPPESCKTSPSAPSPSTDTPSSPRGGSDNGQNSKPNDRSNNGQTTEPRNNGQDEDESSNYGPTGLDIVCAIIQIFAALGATVSSYMAQKRNPRIDDEAIGLLYGLPFLAIFSCSIAKLYPPEPPAYADIACETRNCNKVAHIATITFIVSLFELFMAWWTSYVNAHCGGFNVCTGVFKAIKAIASLVWLIYWAGVTGSEGGHTAGLVVTVCFLEVFIIGGEYCIFKCFFAKYVPRETGNRNRVEMVVV